MKSQKSRKSQDSADREEVEVAVAKNVSTTTASRRLTMKSLMVRRRDKPRLSTKKLLNPMPQLQMIPKLRLHRLQHLNKPLIKRRQVL